LRTIDRFVVLSAIAVIDDFESYVAPIIADKRHRQKDMGEQRLPHLARSASERVRFLPGVRRAGRADRASRAMNDPTNLRSLSSASVDAAKQPASSTRHA
jgi:hypothetical protein